MTSRRFILAGLVFCPIIFALGYRYIPSLLEDEPIETGRDLQMFVDDFLIESLSGDIQQEAVQPEPKEVVLTTDTPWEGNTSSYFTIFPDQGKFRMIYRGWHHDSDKQVVHEEATSYAESTDGITWSRPALGLYEWENSRDNNIIWLGPEAHNFTPFLDGNPAASPAEKYKAVGGQFELGLIPLISADATHWSRLSNKPIITNGAFDSQNVIFWDSARHEYRAYWRYYDEEGFRLIATATSKDFRNWQDTAPLEYTGSTEKEHLYTNAIEPYFRAPRLFVGFPTRFNPTSEQVEPIFIVSRDGRTFYRHSEPVIPITAPKNRDTNRGNFMALGMLYSPDRPREISVYASENYYEATPARLRRFVYRLDGFVTVRAGRDGGELITRPLRPGGNSLATNHIVKPGGLLAIDVLDMEGNVICKSPLLDGDAIDEPVPWKCPPNLTETAIRLRFRMQNAEIFSFRFD